MSFIFLILSLVVAQAAPPSEQITVVPLAEKEFELAYLHVGYSWIGGHGVPVPARIFVKAKPKSAEHLMAYLSHETGVSRELVFTKVQHVDGDPILERTEFAGGEIYEVSGLFPASVLRSLGRASSVNADTGEGPNCFGAAISFYSGEEVSYAGREHFQIFIRSLQSTTSGNSPRFGEVIYFPEVEHAVIYLLGGLIYQKPSIGVYHRFEIVPFEKTFDTFNSTIRTSRGHAGGGSHPSPWDGFLTSISGMKEFPPPPPLQSASPKLQRYH